MKSVTVIGLGHVGLPLAVLLSAENTVYCIDNDKSKLEMIKKGKCYLKDDELQKILEERLNLIVDETYENAINNSSYVIICLPTNGKGSGELDTSLITEEIVKINSVNKKVPIVIKSTVNVGYSKSIDATYENPIIFCPEFCREGHSIEDLLNQDRIVISDVYKDKELVEEFVNMINFNNCPVVTVDWGEAEAIKLLSNTYLATRVALFNEIDTLCHKFGLNSKTVIKGMCLDKRIGDYYNNPSFGYDGYCLPKDSDAIANMSKDLTLPLIQGLDFSNDCRTAYMFDVINKDTNVHSILVYEYDSLEDLIKSRNVQFNWFITGLIEHSYNITFNKNDIDNCDLILTNRWHEELKPYKYKVLTRDMNC